MSTQRATAAQKAKAAAPDGEGASPNLGRAPRPALETSRVTSVAHLVKVRPLAASDFNERGVTELQPGGVPGLLRAPFYPVFLHSLFAGLIPPFSDFFIAILEHYQIQLLHLHPNAILTLSIFAYFCEAYVGVRPSVDFFRNFFSLHLLSYTETTGCVSFRLYDGMFGNYPPIAWDGDVPVPEVTTEVEGFRQRWLFVRVLEVCPFLEVPDGPPTRHQGWGRQQLAHESLEVMERRLAEARLYGLTG